MRNVLIIFLALALCAGGVGTFRMNEELARARQKIQQLQDKLESQAKMANLDLQEKCSKQDRIEFNSEGWTKKDMASFENHYNASMNKCFIRVQSLDSNTARGTIFQNETVSDAFEGTMYGQYMWMSDKIKKYWENPPKVCSVTSPSGEKTFCTSEDEFNKLLKPYMERDTQ